MSLNAINLDSLRSIPTVQKVALLGLVVAAILVGFYYYVVENWLRGDPAQPLPESGELLQGQGIGSVGERERGLRRAPRRRRRVSPSAIVRKRWKPRR